MNDKHKKRILIIDDDIELAELLKDYIQSEGFMVVHEPDGARGLQTALNDMTGRFDLIILDVMLPSQSGLDILKQIRTQSLVPVLMLTAKGDDTERIVGLELGADDYVPKPATAREILARVKAILRRTELASAPQAPVIEVGQLRINNAARTITLAGKPVALTSTEFNCLELLARHAGTVVSRDQLSEEVLGRPLQRFDRSIDVHISRVRDKLATASTGANEPRINTIYRQGYQLSKDV